MRLPGAGGHQTAEEVNGDPAGPHEAAVGPAGQGGQEAEGEAEAFPEGGRERGL